MFKRKFHVSKTSHSVMELHCHLHFSLISMKIQFFIFIFLYNIRTLNSGVEDIGVGWGGVGFLFISELPLITVLFSLLSSFACKIYGLYSRSAIAI